MTYFFGIFFFFFTILFSGKNQFMVSFVPEIDLYTFCQQNFITFKANFSLFIMIANVSHANRKKKKKEVSELLYK